jgi:hypothetical protein
MLAAASALGLLAGFGVREGAPLVVLGAAGLRLRGLPEFITPDRGVGPMTLLGALHATLVAYGWGLLAASVARRLRGWPAVAALAALAAALVLIDPLLPAFLRLGAGAPSTGERVLCTLVIAAAAGLGTRLAPPPRRAAAATLAVEPRGDARRAVAADADVTDLRAMGEPNAPDGTTREMPVAPPPRGVALDVPRSLPANLVDDETRPVRDDRQHE